jgi:hypothetical protein
VDEGKSPLAIALDHARLRWAAGIENAARLSARASGILAVIGTILGLGLFKAADMRPQGHLALYCALMSFVMATLFLLLAALFQVLVHPLPTEGADGGDVVDTTPIGERETPEDRANVYASDNLHWPRKPSLHPTELETEQEALRIAYTRLTKAANSLDRRNLRRKVRIDRGQHFLFGAAGTAAVSIVLYALLQVPAGAHEQEQGPSVPGPERGKDHAAG